MNILFSSLHHVDNSNSSVRSISITLSSTLIDYTNKLFKQINESENKKIYTFKSDKTEVRQVIENVINNKERNDSVELSASRLLEKETKAQEWMDSRKMKVKILKGSLFQTLIEIDGEKKVIICKADHNQYLDENSLSLRSGLPWDKKIFKAALIHINNDNSIFEEVDILDVNHSKYWYDDFLELREKHNSSYNTQQSMNKIDIRVFNNIKKKYPSDYWILRNSFIGFFRSKSNFEIEDFISTLLDDYYPVDIEFPKDSIVNKIRALPKQFDFDSSFSISKKDIKKRASRKVKIAENIDLHLKNHIKNFKGIIHSGKTDSGQMFIQVFTEEESVYEQFKRRAD
ncbi:hypothetical protein [uncultured Kordia sp.]|uniref:hypothetical protein n=1 Tax=uncultured Kordia sp. TaxID=507699 RepID=UPI00261E457B|nr:hypothetical protein [uncultured Kordia sp.]